jgi:hypothetical protein
VFAAGYRLAVDNGEDAPVITSYDAALGMQPSTDAVLAVMFATDDEYLLAYKIENALDPNDLRDDAWIRFVYGNDGYNVISDYSVNLEAVLKPVNDYADTLA